VLGYGAGVRLVWGSYDATHRPALGRLAAACLAVDGGLPLFAGGDLLSARMLGGRGLYRALGFVAAGSRGRFVATGRTPQLLSCGA
jgi:hypothetical protein